MAIDVACSKGCGVAIHVPDSQLEEFSKMGQPIMVSHSECPRDVVEDKQPEYRVTLEVHRISKDDPDNPVLLTRNGATVKAPLFVDAFAKLSTELGSQWSEARKWAEVAENDLSR